MEINWKTHEEQIAALCDKALIVGFIFGCVITGFCAVAGIFFFGLPGA